MKELKTVTKLVKLILEQDERARNSDNYLYFRVIGVLSMEKGVDANMIPVTAFLLNMKAWDFPGFETVRRTRQKIQREYPELAGKPEVKDGRAEREEVFREYAVDPIGG